MLDEVHWITMMIICWACFVWPITGSRFDKEDPTSTYASIGIALNFIEPCKPSILHRQWFDKEMFPEKNLHVDNRCLGLVYWITIVARSI